MFQRRAYYGGLSVELVLSKQSAHAAENEEKSIVQQVDEAMRGKARLDFIFTDQWETNGYDRVWLDTNLREYDIQNHLAAVSAWFPKAPMAAHALLIVMSEHWASPDEANITPAVTMTDWAVLCEASTLVGKDKELPLMKFIGHLYRHSPRQAALALHTAQRVTLDFYREHVGETEVPMPASKKETNKEILRRMDIEYGGPLKRKQRRNDNEK